MAACAFAIGAWADEIYIYILFCKYKLINIFSAHLTQTTSYRSATIFHHLAAKKLSKMKDHLSSVCSSFSESFSVPLGAKTSFTLFLSERVEIG